MPASWRRFDVGTASTSVDTAGKTRANAEKRLKATILKVVEMMVCCWYSDDDVVVRKKRPMEWLDSELIDDSGVCLCWRKNDEWEWLVYLSWLISYEFHSKHWESGGYLEARIDSGQGRREDLMISFPSLFAHTQGCHPPLYLTQTLLIITQVFGQLHRQQKSVLDVYLWWLEVRERCWSSGTTSKIFSMIFQSIISKTREKHEWWTENLRHDNFLAWPYKQSALALRCSRRKWNGIPGNIIAFQNAVQRISEIPVPIPRWGMIIFIPNNHLVFAWLPKKKYS